MSVLALLEPGWSRSDGASKEQIERLEATLGVRLPDDYREVMLWSNGGEGQIGDHYLSLWTTDEIEQLNIDYQLPKYLPRVIAVGSDGGGMCYAFDHRTLGVGPFFVEVPFGDLDPGSIVVHGATLEESLRTWMRDRG